MTQPESGAAPPPSSDARVPRGTTPTWEIEMLLSGAVVFALMQVPGALDSTFDRLFLRLDGTFGVAALLVYSYTKAIVYALILTFLFHLAARAYWIALVGIDSVYPGGPKWANRKMGRIARETLEARVVPPGELIGRADDRCSLIFASGILLVLFALFSLLGTILLGAIAYALSEILFGGRDFATIMLVLAAAISIPSAIAMFVDRLRGDRLARGGTPARLIAFSNAAGFRMPVLRHALPLLYTLSTNRPTQRVYVLLVVAMLGIVYFVMGEVLVRREVLRFDMYAYLPDQPTSYALDPDHYEDRREPASAAMLPYIQSEIVIAPYVRLFVPYLAERHELGLQLACPGLKPLTASRFRMRTRGTLDDARSLETLACFSKMLAIELDGEPVDVTLHFGSDARTAQRGVVAVIPVTSLEKGRHVVALRRPPRKRDAPVNPGTEEQPASGESRGTGAEIAQRNLRYEIPFWR